MLELLHTLLFSLISGFSEFIFSSVSAHQLLYNTVTGTQLPDEALRLSIHIGALLALLVQCSKRLKHLRNERRLARSTHRRRSYQADPASIMDMRIVNTAAVPAVLSVLFPTQLLQVIQSPGWTVLFLLLNGAILFIPTLVRTGNKDSRSYTMFDGLLMGLAGAFGIIPGIGRLGCMFSVGLLRGADRNYALDLSLLISIPVILFSVCMDIYAVAMARIDPVGLQTLGYILAAMASFGGAYLSIMLLRTICRQNNSVSFAYYDWGLAGFMFLLYLIIH